MSAHIVHLVQTLYGLHQATGAKCLHTICTVFAHKRPFAVAVWDGRTIDHLYPIAK